MSAKGRPRKDALRVRRSKRQAEANQKADEATKRKKQAEESDHEVEETLSLRGGGSEPQPGIGKNKKEKPAGIIHFDNVFGDMHLDFEDTTPEIEPLRCGNGRWKRRPGHSSSRANQRKNKKPQVHKPVTSAKNQHRAGRILLRWYFAL